MADEWTARKGAPEALGEPDEDAAGNRYGRMFDQPMLVFAANLGGLQTAHRHALSREVRIVPPCICATC
ncbi:hypothetical protein GEM_3429 [Burkholderia cepacia GG4]|uniref:Uncharacterized protein n=1 Tax=Burkholderia cepacia GG4 TaxID=1009846 RepID=A0A9W3PAS3_BURCE|nr:hypothetical protein GEM_3429 [Burkholderia cepacia GG4]